MEFERDKETIFAELYKEYVGYVYKTVLYYVKDHYATEEIVQSVFMKLYIYMDCVNALAIKSWLLITARNMAMNYNRDSKHEFSMEGYPEDQKEFILESTETECIKRFHAKQYDELLEKIFAEIYCINPDWYYALTIHYILEKPQQEAAESMGISLAAYRSMLYRVRKWIKDNYGEEFRQIDD